MAFEFDNFATPLMIFPHAPFAFGSMVYGYQIRGWTASAQHKSQHNTSLGMLYQLLGRFKMWSGGDDHDKKQL